MAPRCSSGASIVRRSNGSWILPSTIFVTTWGLPTVSSKPSRRICSTRMARASSPRPCTSQVSGRSVGRTRTETLPTSSASRRALRTRAVSLVPPLRPASGEVFTPTVIEMAGSSTVIRVSGRGSSTSASVSPMVMSAMPAMATRSPALASSAGTRSSASVMRSSVILTRWVVPSSRHQATISPLRILPAAMRQSAMRPRNVEASRFVTSARSGASTSTTGAGMWSSSTWNSVSRFSSSGRPPSSGWVSDARPARAEANTTGRSSTESSAPTSVARSSSRSWVSSTTSEIRASGRSTLLTSRITGRPAASVLRSTKRVCGSGPSDASTSSTTPSTIASARSTSPPKSAWPGVSTTLMTTSPSGVWRRTAVFFARIVMPFSRSSSPESMTRSTSSARAEKAPD